MTEYYGLMAEFSTDETLLAASGRAYEAGYRRMEAYSPFPIDGLNEALGRQTHYWLNWLVLGGLFAGAAAALGLQYYATVIDYPVNIGGRPLNSWPAFVPPAFELAILLAAFAGMGGLFFFGGLPRWRHPIFNVPRFKLATKDRFFLVIEAADAQYNSVATRRFLEGLEAVEVSAVTK